MLTGLLMYGIDRMNRIQLFLENCGRDERNQLVKCQHCKKIQLKLYDIPRQYCEKCDKSMYDIRYEGLNW